MTAADHMRDAENYLRRAAICFGVSAAFSVLALVLMLAKVLGL